MAPSFNNPWKRKLVWPRDLHKRRNYLDGIKDVLSGRGPDMFLQAKDSNQAIRPDEWSNWKGYTSLDAHVDEMGRAHCRLWDAARASERYDPHRRRYVEWFPPHDWFGAGIAGDPRGYPRLTRGEARRIASHWERGVGAGGDGGSGGGSRGDLEGSLPRRPGPGWDGFGPKRFRPEYDEFWQHAHRRGNNRALGLPSDWPIHDNWEWHQNDADEKIGWAQDAGLIR